MDEIIIYRIFTILAEMGLHSPISPYFDFDPEDCIKKYGSHQLYEFAVLIWDDLDRMEFKTAFREHLNKYNSLSEIKVDFYKFTEYPSTIKNFTTVYLTVATI